MRKIIYLSVNDFKTLERMINQHISGKEMEGANVLGILRVEDYPNAPSVHTFQMCTHDGYRCAIDGEPACLDGFGYDIVRGRITLTIGGEEHIVTYVDQMVVYKDDGIVKEE